MQLISFVKRYPLRQFPNWHPAGYIKKKNNMGQKVDNVNHPPHYTWLKDKCGIEVIDITRHMGFCLGNAIKYILRAGHKQDASLTDNQKEIEDLKKAIWYIKDRIKQLGSEI